jgi:hypothetical protein
MRPIQTRSLYNSARLLLLYRLVRMFIGAHRQELSVPNFGVQDTNKIMPALESNADTRFEKVPG